MSQKKEISENILRTLYIKQGLPASEVARILGCSLATIRRNLRQYGIVKREITKN